MQLSLVCLYPSRHITETVWLQQVRVNGIWVVSIGETLYRLHYNDIEILSTNFPMISEERRSQWETNDESKYEPI